MPTPNIIQVNNRGVIMNIQAKAYSSNAEIVKKVKAEYIRKMTDSMYNEFEIDGDFNDGSDYWGELVSHVFSDIARDNRDTKGRIEAHYNDCFDFVVNYLSNIKMQSHCIECGKEVELGNSISLEHHVFCSMKCYGSCVGFTYVDGMGYKLNEELEL